MASLISHEKDVFRKHFGALTQCLTQQEDLIPLVMQFYSEGIIGEELRNHILDAGGMNGQQKAAKFLTAVERYIADKPASIEVVVQLFMTSSTCKYVADMMQLDTAAPVESLEHESPRLGERKAYERHSKSRQISLPEHLLHDSEHMLQRVNSFEPGTSFTQTNALQSPNRQPLPKQATFPPYHSDLVTVSEASHFSQLSLSTTVRDRAGTFPIDVHSPSPTSREKLLPLSVTEPSASVSTKILSSSPLTSRNDKAQVTLYQPSVSTGSSLTSSATNTATREQETLVSNQPPAETRVHLQCEVMNAQTRKTIKCTSSSGQNHPLLRSIKLKVKKYDTVAPYTPLQLNLSAGQSCYVYIINIGSAGDQTVLVPNEFEEHNYLEAGKVMMFPSSTADYEFELDENCGLETIVLMAYQSPLENCDQAISDCGAFRKGSIKEEMPVEIHRGIKVKPKRQRQQPIGFLEIQFAVSEFRNTT